MIMPMTGVVTVGDWSLKAWWSMSRRAWLVQVEHRLPERGGWVRAWLSPAGEGPQAFSGLTEAWAAIDTFLAHPTWSHCREFAGV